MPKTYTVLLRSLSAGLCAAVATFVLSYPFFLIHEEAEIRPSVAWWIALLSFFLTTLLALVYFALRNKRSE